MIKSSPCASHSYCTSISFDSILLFVLFLWYFVAATVQFPRGDHECFISSHLILPSFFFLKVCAAFFYSPKDCAAVRCCCFWAGTRCALRSSHDAGFLPDKARVWAGRLNDPQGKVVSALSNNGVQQRRNVCMCETAAYKQAQTTKTSYLVQPRCSSSISQP